MTLQSNKASCSFYKISEQPPTFNLTQELLKILEEITIASFGRNSRFNAVKVFLSFERALLERWYAILEKNRGWKMN